MAPPGTFILPSPEFLQYQRERKKRRWETMDPFKKVLYLWRQNNYYRQSSNYYHDSRPFFDDEDNSDDDSEYDELELIPDGQSSDYNPFSFAYVDEDLDFDLVSDTGMAETIPDEEFAQLLSWRSFSNSQ